MVVVVILNFWGIKQNRLRVGLGRKLIPRMREMRSLEFCGGRSNGKIPSGHSRDEPGPLPTRWGFEMNEGLIKNWIKF